MTEFFRCPRCKSSEGLWRGVEVPGWQSVGPDLKPIGGPMDREADWSAAEGDGTYGCGECNWEGFLNQLEITDEQGRTEDEKEKPDPNQLVLNPTEQEGT